MSAQSCQRQAYLRAAPTGPAWEAAIIERNWLIYKLVPRPGKKPAKHPAHPQTGNAPISVYDAARLTFAEALAALDRLSEQHGLGYLPRPGSAMVGIDYDDVYVTPGKRTWTPHWQEVREKDPHGWEYYRYPTWVELSPSGAGVRMLSARIRLPRPSYPWLPRAELPAIDAEADGFGYFGGGGRFFTVTFQTFGWWQDQTQQGKPIEIVCAKSIVELVLARIEGRKIERPKVKLVDEPDEPSEAARWFNQLTERRQLEEVGRMLAHLTDPKFGLDYELWLRISFAVYRATDSMGFEIWDRWCRRLPNYDAAENAKKWASGLHEPGRGPAVTVGTLIMHACQGGYRPPLDAGFRRALRHWAGKQQRQTGRVVWRW